MFKNSNWHKHMMDQKKNYINFHKFHQLQCMLNNNNIYCHTILVLKHKKQVQQRDIVLTNMFHDFFGC